MSDLALNERFALKDLVEWPREIPYNFRAADTGKPETPSSMETLCAKGLVYEVERDRWGNPCFRPTPDGYDRYFADDLEAINFRKLYPDPRRKKR